jgi:hypothetical protein
MFLVDDSLDGGWSWLLGDSGWYSHRGSTSGEWWWIGFPKLIKIRVPPVPDICHLRWQWFEILNSQSQMVCSNSKKDRNTIIHHYLARILLFYLFLGSLFCETKRCPVPNQCEAIMQEMISANVEKRTVRESLEERCFGIQCVSFS